MLQFCEIESKKHFCLNCYKLVKTALNCFAEVLFSSVTGWNVTSKFFSLNLKFNFFSNFFLDNNFDFFI